MSKFLGTDGASMMTAPFVMPTIPDERLDALRAALAEFDAALASEQSVEYRLNAVATDGSADAEHEFVRLLYEEAFRRLRAASAVVDDLASSVKPGAECIIAGTSVYVVLVDEEGFVGKRLKFSTERTIVL